VEVGFFRIHPSYSSFMNSFGHSTNLSPRREPLGRTIRRTLNLIVKWKWGTVLTRFSNLLWGRYCTLATLILRVHNLFGSFGSGKSGEGGQFFNLDKRELDDRREPLGRTGLERETPLNNSLTCLEQSSSSFCF